MYIIRLSHVAAWINGTGQSTLLIPIDNTISLGSQLIRYPQDGRERVPSLVKVLETVRSGGEKIRTPTDIENKLTASLTDTRNHLNSPIVRVLRVFECRRGLDHAQVTAYSAR